MNIGEKKICKECGRTLSRFKEFDDWRTFMDNKLKKNLPKIR